MTSETTGSREVFEAMILGGLAKFLTGQGRCTRALEVRELPCATRCGWPPARLAEAKEAATR
eukprot:1411730-Pyramimonas_sp.AAC.1